MRPPFVDRNFGRPGAAILLAVSDAQFGGAYVAWIVRNWRGRLGLGLAVFGNRAKSVRLWCVVIRGV